MELRNKTLSGATQYISNMKNPLPFLRIQCSGNDIDYTSIYTVEQNITSLFRRAKMPLADTHISFSVVYHQSVPTDKRTNLEEKIKLLSTEYKIDYISLFNICNYISYFYDVKHLNDLGLEKKVQIYKHIIYPKHGLTYKALPVSKCVYFRMKVPMPNESADDLGDLIDLGTSHMFFNSKKIDLTTVNHFCCL